MNQFVHSPDFQIYFVRTFLVVMGVIVAIGIVPVTIAIFSSLYTLLDMSTKYYGACGEILDLRGQVRDMQSKIYYLTAKKVDTSIS